MSPTAKEKDYPTEGAQQGGEYPTEDEPQGQGGEPTNEYPTEDDHGKEPADGGDDVENEGFCSGGNLRCIQVQAFGATLSGYSIGFVAVYSYLFLASTDCSRFSTREGCEPLPNAECTWDAARSSCGWREFSCGWSYPGDGALGACLADERCTWVYSKSECKNPTGYTSSNNGIFAGAMILGSTVGSIYAGQFAAKFGHNLSFLIVGIVGVVSSVMYHVSADTNEFWVLCVGRLLIGVVIALLCCACPMYVDQNASEKCLKMIGVLFQVFQTFGIMLAAVMGLALGQSIKDNTDAQLIGRMQGLCAVSTLLSVFMILLGIVIDEGKASFDSGKKSAKGGNDDALDPNEYGYCQMIGPLMMGAVISGTLQLTGFNAVMNFAPTIMGNLGLEPMVGNIIVMAWNFVTTLFSIPLSRIFTMRQLFLTCSLVASCACLFLCGIPVYPGVAEQRVKNGVAIAGLAVFIAAFEIGVGPCFYVLAQDLFPPSFRPKGCSFTMLVQFIFNVIINVCYPIATERISGGASGNQDKGQAIAFIFFGGIGLICFVLQVLFLYPWEEGTAESDSPEDADAASGATNEQSPIEVATPGNRQTA